MAAKPENLERILTPVLVGSVLSCIFAGLVLSLAMTYFTRFNSDVCWVKGMVCFLTISGIMGSGFDVSWLYNWSVTNFLRPHRLGYIPWEMSAFHFLNGLIIAIVQHFYLFKCWVTAGRTKLAVNLVFSLISLASFGVSIYLTALAGKNRQLTGSNELKNATWAWYAGVLAVDLFIFMSMLDHLVFRPRIKPTMSKKLDDVKSPVKSQGRTFSNRVFYTNALSLVVQTIVLAMFAVRSNGLQYLTFAFFAPKVYIVSLLATLNSHSPHGNGALDPIETFTLDAFKPRYPLHNMDAPVRVVVQHEQMIDQGDDDDEFDTLDGHKRATKGSTITAIEEGGGGTEVTPYQLNFDDIRGKEGKGT